MKIGWLGKNGVQGTNLLDRFISVLGCLKWVLNSLFRSRPAIFPVFLSPAQGHHTMQPNAFPDMHCTMLIKKPTRSPIRILIPSLQKSTALLITFDVKR